MCSPVPCPPMADFWPSVACSLSCLSLNIARQSAGPWASRSTKVKLTRSPPIMTPPSFSLSLSSSLLPSCSKANTAHRSPTSTLYPFHGSAESGVWAASTCEGIQIQSELKHFRTHKSFEQLSFLSVSSRSPVTCVLVDPKDTWIFLYLCKFCQVIIVTLYLWCLLVHTAIRALFCLFLFCFFFFFAAADKDTRAFIDNS